MPGNGKAVYFSMENQLIYCAFYNLDCIYDYHLECTNSGDIWRYKPHRQKNCFLKSWIFVKRKIDFLLKAQPKVKKEVSVVSIGKSDTHPISIHNNKSL